MNVTLEQLQESIPGYAKDLKLNLSSLLRQTELTPQQTWGTAVASALAAGNNEVYTALLDEARKNLSPEALEAAKAAAAIMGMNNVFYRFQHLVEKEKYNTIPTRLRMNVIRQHGADPVDFELWSLAVSAVNGCGKCITSHERVLIEKGVNEETITVAIRLASVVSAIAAVFNVEPVAVPVAG
jgi:lipoyl-dependent peroxiredoxin subunit D